MSEETNAETKNEDAIKGGDGNYFFDPKNLEGFKTGPGYSTSVGGVVEGDATQGGLMVMPAGTGADPHKHANEQFIYVVQGTLDMRVEDEEARLEEGMMAFVPGDTVHELSVVGDTDVHFFTVKDLSHGIIGDPVDED